MKHKHDFRIVAMFLLAVLLLAACSSAGFDPENKQEYGVGGIYLGQNVKEALDVLKPTRADFMDMVSRQTYTVEQMAQGAGHVRFGRTSATAVRDGRRGAGTRLPGKPLQGNLWACREQGGLDEV